MILIFKMKIKTIKLKFLINKGFNNIKCKIYKTFNKFIKNLNKIY